MRLKLETSAVINGILYEPGEYQLSWAGVTRVRSSPWPKRTVPLLEKPYTKADKVVG